MNRIADTGCSDSPGTRDRKETEAAPALLKPTESGSKRCTLFDKISSWCAPHLLGHLGLERGLFGLFERGHPQVAQHAGGDREPLGHELLALLVRVGRRRRVV